MRETLRTPVGDLILGAARIRAEAEAYNGLHPVTGDLRRADQLEGRAREHLPERLTELGAGGELIPTRASGEPAEYRNTMRNPDYVAAAASRDRMDLLQEVGALEAGLDLADTVSATNSMERMLVHQQAIAHRSALKMAKQLDRAIERMNSISDGPRQTANVETARLAGSMSKLMLTFQQGALTLERMRSGGHQIVTVQRVSVGAGGQAVIAGSVSPGGGQEKEGGNGRENEQ